MNTKRKPNRTETEGNTSTIYIRSGGREIPCLVDTADLALLSERTWTLNTDRYAFNSSGTVLMHRLLVTVPAGMVTDHINGNRLDNRRSNLRVVTEVTNGHNRHSHNRGIDWMQSFERWRVRFCVNHKSIACGLYKTKEEAEAVAHHFREKLRRGENIDAEALAARAKSATRRLPSRRT